MEFPKRFVCEDPVYASYTEHIASPLFRKRFFVESNVNRAEVLISGLGFYDLYLNGRKITKGILAPYIANWNHYVYFDKYDIAPLLHEGENVIGVMLGDGPLNGKKGKRDDSSEGQNSAPILALHVEIQCEEQTISFDAGDMVCKKGPILFNDLRTGVFYDARRLEDGWCSPGFIEEGWYTPVQVEAPMGEPILCQVEPVVVYKEMAPVSFWPGELADYARKFEVPLPEGEPARTGGYIYDFGENNSGIFRLKIKGTPGQRVDILCAEQICDGKLNYSNMKFYPDGYAQRDVYYLRGGEEEVFEPQFIYHGFRYIYISGITPEQATADLLTYLVAGSQLESTGTFSCSDPVANTIYAMGRRSDISNFYYYPTDCPQREKNGWTGDIALSAEHMLMTLSAEDSLEEWLRQLRAAQAMDGRLPGIAPTNRKWVYHSLTGPAWDIALFEVPYQIWKYRGKTQQIMDNAAAMLRYLEYVSRRNEKGLVHYGIGDSMPVGKKPENFDADVGFTDSVMVYRACCLASEMFEAVGLALHKSFADQLGGEMLTAIRREYVKDCTIVPSCQTVQAMALYYGVFQPEEEQRAFEVLLGMLEKENYYFTCGVLGIRVLFHVLAKYGKAELAYELITRKEFPSYGYWAAKGETTMLEGFTPYDQYFDDSKNHHFLGDVVGWFMRWCGGIHVVRADYVEISPCYIPQLEECRSSLKMSAGSIDVHWKRENGTVSLAVNATGTVQYKII